LGAVGGLVGLEEVDYRLEALHAGAAEDVAARVGGLGLDARGVLPHARGDDADPEVGVRLVERGDGVIDELGRARVVDDELPLRHGRAEQGERGYEGQLPDHAYLLGSFRADLTRVEDGVRTCVPRLPPPFFSVRKNRSTGP